MNSEPVDNKKDTSVSNPGIRLLVVRTESPLSPMLYHSIQWICSCMCGKSELDKAGLRIEAINLWRLLHESVDSQVRNGWYSVKMPYLVRLAHKKTVERERLSNVLQFQRSGQLEDVAGVYTCRIYLKLSNPSWRLSPCDCSFIEGRGVCAVTIYLYDFCLIGPLPCHASIVSTVSNWVSGLFYNKQ